MNQGKFGYQANITNLENYIKENERIDSQADGPRWWSIPSGMSSVRILPPWDPSGRIALTVYSHPIEFQGKGMKYKKYSWTCVNKTFGKPCNICQGLDSIRESGIDVSSYEPTRKTFYFNAIVMFDPDYDKDSKMGKKPEDCSGVAPGTHVLMRAPKTLYDWVVTNITNPMIGDITSVTNGIDIIITKEGSGLGTTYTPTLSPNGRQPIPQEYLDKIENLYNLDDIFSTGFEKEQVDELVQSLYRSSNSFMTGTPNMLQQMSGGYIPQNTNSTMYSQTGTVPQSPVQPYVSSNNQTKPTTAPAFPQTPPAAFGAAPAFPQTPPAAFGAAPAFNSVQQPQSDTPPFEVGNLNPVQQQPQSNTPPCFGKEYNATNVKCVTCSHEIPCSQNCK